MAMPRYSERETAWLRDNYHIGSLDDTIDLFEAEFGRRPSRSGLQSKASSMGLRKDSTMAWDRWTPERIAWFRSFVPGHTEREIAEEHERLFGSRLTRAQVKNGKFRFGVCSGTHGGRFEKGCAGGFKDEEHRRRFLEAGMATRFKKGNLPHNAVDPVGAERIDKDGYTWVKIAERKRDPKSAHDNWAPKHRLVYEQAHGPIPVGCMVVFLDGNKTNFDPDNLAIETKSEHAVIARHGIGFHDAETHAIARAIARLKSAKHAARTVPR